MPPKMWKQWMRHKVEVMKVVVASNREVVMELEEHPGMAELGIRLKRSTDQLCKFFCFCFCLWSWDSVRIVVDEKHLRLVCPPQRPSSTGFVVPSISPLTRFADLSLRSPAIASLVSNSPGTPGENPSPTPERVTARANDEALLSSAE